MKLLLDYDSPMALYKSEERDKRVLGVTDEEIKEMREIFGEDVIPNREMYPSSFEYYYKVYRVFKYDKAFRDWKENIHNRKS